MRLEKKFIGNVLFAGVGHLINVTFTLLYIPIVLPIIGISNIGVIGMISSFAGIFSILADYSFNITGVRDIVESHNNQNRLRKVYYTIIYTKLIFFVGLSSIYIALINVVPLFTPYRTAYFFGLLMVFGQALSINFYFQATESFKWSSIITIFSRGISLILIILFIKTAQDYLLIPLFIGLGTTITNLVALTQIALYTYLKPSELKFKEVMSSLKEGYLITVSNLAITIYIQGNIFFLGLFVTPAVVGYFSICEKIILGIRQILGVFANIMYPKMLKSVHIMNNQLKDVKIYFYGLYLLMFLIAAVLNIYAAEVIYLVSRLDVNKFNLTAFRLFTLVPIIVSFNIYPSTLLNIKGHIKKGQIILLIGVLLSIILNLLLGYAYSLLGIIIAILAVESFITISLIVQNKKLRPA